MSISSFIAAGVYLTNASAAFQALQAQDEMPNYQANTSDEESDSELGSTVPPTPLVSMDITAEQSTIVIPTLLPKEQSRYVHSNFTPNDDNVIYGDNYVIFGLKTNQNVLIRGQFTLEIQRGAIEINGVVYHSSSEPLKFINPISNALPLIQATQVTDSSLLRNVSSVETKHLFTSAYKSVIRVSNLHTGLEGIGRLAPQLKHLFWNFNNLSSDDIKNLNEHEEAFTGYTFFPTLKPDNTVSILKYRQWENTLYDFTSLYKNNDLLKIVVIGGKNSGKSTFLRLLHERILSTTADLPLHILDLDPGQCEYSRPDCISLSSHTSVHHGNHLSLTSPSNSKTHYIGFSSPKDQPNRYDTLVNDLIATYEADGAIKHESLLVNTPGWIKGYGLSLTKKLIERLKPTHVVYLNNGTPDLEDLKIPPGTEIVPADGVYNSSVSKFSAAQLRLCKLLGYFHKKHDFAFDFEPLLFGAPLQVSYGEDCIRGVVVLGEDGLDAGKSKEIIEAGIVAVCSVAKTVLDGWELKGNGLQLIDSKWLNPVTDIKTHGLGLVHSVDTQKKLVNIYIPEFEDLSKQDTHEYILVRGRTEVPIAELASNEVVKKFGRTNLPYVSFEKLSEYDKNWKVRKNVQRRGQQ